MTDAQTDTKQASLEEARAIARRVLAQHGFNNPFGAEESACVDAIATALAVKDAELAEARKALAEKDAALHEADFWLEGALTCKTWNWDADQHEAATGSLERIRAARRVREAQGGENG